MKNIIWESLSKSISYKQYRTTVTDLLNEGQSTGPEQSESLLNYSLLNETRMNRLDKTITISEPVRRRLQALKKEIIWLVISEGWCGDAAQLLPIFNKMAAVSEKIILKIVFRDENPELMQLFLTNGSKSIPKLIVLDKVTFDALADWGPRPQGAIDLINAFKAQYGQINEEAKTALQLWYLKDKGLSTQDELSVLIEDL